MINSRYFVCLDHFIAIDSGIQDVNDVIISQLIVLVQQFMPPL